MKMYNASFKSKQTAISYSCHLKKYSDNLPELLSLSQKEAEDKLIDFIISNKESKSWAALHNYLAAVARFYLINDIPLNLRRVNRFMPEQIKLKKDRAYEQEEILKIIELANERTRALILLLASTGVRIGALPDLTCRHLVDKGDIYKITVYENTNNEYFTFCTPECKKALDTYFEIRKRHGEIITAKSPVIREHYDKESEFAARHPRHTTRAALTVLLKDILELAGLRTRIKKTGMATSLYKKDVMLAHGFRKFFNTQLVSVRINPLIKELLMGHIHVGLEDAYYRPLEDDIQAEYEKAIDALTIDPSQRLKRELVHEKQKNTETSKILARLAKLEGEIGIKI
jgi:integrase